jgi:adenosylmethionine-8-amino-7-oxononanoate aminotransferase
MFPAAVGSLDHLWLHFTEMGRYRAGEELQVIVRGDGCYLEDAAGRGYLDALAGLFCVNIGYGYGEEMGEAAAAQATVALKNIEIMRRERIVEHVRESEGTFCAELESLLALPIVGDLRGTGFFYALELVKDRETRASFSDEECDELLRRFVPPRLFEEGLICRADDRGDPVVQISPPLVAGQEQFQRIAGTLGTVLEEAGRRMQVAA